jgi:hypothetical protein
MRPGPRHALVLPALLTLLGCATAARAPAAVPAAFPAVDSLARRPVAGGVEYFEVRVPSGPWAIHIVEVDREACRPVLRSAKAGPPSTERARTSALAAGALAGVNGDFFALPAGTTVGADVSAGVTRAGPGLRPAFALLPSDLFAGTLVTRGWVAAPGDTLAVTQVNRPLAGDAQHPPLGGATQLTAWIGSETPIDSLAVLVLVRPIAGDARAGRGVIRAMTDGLDPRPLAGLAFATQDEAWTDRRSPGDTISWEVGVIAAAGSESVREAVGGFPLLLLDGRDALAAAAGVSEGFGAARHPRTALGWNDRHLFLVVVDGRQAPYSDGMTLAELRDLFLRIGADTAINLDGGGSSALVVRGHVVNRPSDREGERPVGNALLLDRCAAER